ncbi:hypothetical protein ACIA8G_36735 [Lentzea sp. NPDC051213]|uniref:hypothetical protein n=1 Tax=Lentzea sp. NPDC051213 TaxID=3364126 RepID=UPI0037A6E1E4
MLVGATGTAVTTFQAGPEEAHAVLCAVLKKVRALGCTTRRLGRGMFECDTGDAVMMLTMAPPAGPHPAGTYLLCATVTGALPGDLTRELIACVEFAAPVTVPSSRRPREESRR